MKARLTAAVALVAVASAACPADAPPRDPAPDAARGPEPGPTLSTLRALDDLPATVDTRAVGDPRWTRGPCRHTPRVGQTALLLAPTLIDLGAEPAWPERAAAARDDDARAACERGDVGACVARALTLARHEDLDAIGAIAARACAERPAAACRALVDATPSPIGSLAPPPGLEHAAALRPRCAVGGEAACRALFAATFGPPAPLTPMDADLEEVLVERCRAGIEPACALLAATGARRPDDELVAADLEGARVRCERRREGVACVHLAAALAPHDPAAAAEAARFACALGASLDCPSGELLARCRGGEVAACVAAGTRGAGEAAAEAARERCARAGGRWCRVFAALRLARDPVDPAAVVEAEVAAAPTCHLEPARCRADADALAAEPWALRAGAALLWRAACEGGDAAACEALAYHDGEALLPGTPDGANAAWYERHVALRREGCATHPRGEDCEHLGRIHEHGCAGDVELAAAARAYGAGCGRDGASVACVRLAALHVRVWARGACAAGDLPACARLLALYDARLAVPADPAAVAILTERVVARWSGSCADGDVASCLALFEVPGGIASVDRVRLARGVCDRDEPRGCEILAELTDDEAERDHARVKASGLHLEWCDQGRPESCLALASMLRRRLVPGARKARERRAALLANAAALWAARCDAGDGAACVDHGLARLAAHDADTAAAFRALSRASGLPVGGDTP